VRDTLDDLSLHHVGVIVRSIEAYVRNSLWQPFTDIVHDQIQGARLCLAGISPGMSPAIELVEPDNQDSPLWKALERGTSWHHLCFQVPSVERADELIKEHRMLQVTAWAPAVLFGGRPVRFVYSRNRELVEFLSEEV
jgi:hypothetical protein